jgi:hypothetical protein
MRFIMILALTFFACTDHPSEKVGEVAVRDCGAAPLAPGWSVAFDQTTGAATMSGADFANIQSWRTAVTAWEECVINHP